MARAGTSPHHLGLAVSFPTDPTIPQNYSGDIGDVASFLDHMRSRADETGVDLLLVYIFFLGGPKSITISGSTRKLTGRPFPFLSTDRDAGDHHDGPGLVTSTEYGADVSDYLLSKLSFDVLAIGNHEMYKYDVVKSVYDRIQEGRW
jgi:hypothetical protein